MTGGFDRLRETEQLGTFVRLLKEVEAGCASGSDVERLQRVIADLDARMAGRRHWTDALGEFTKLLAGRNGIAHVLALYRIPGVSDSQRLTELFWTMIRCGAGQCVGRRFVPTACLYDPQLLMLVLQKEHEGIRAEKLAMTAIKYVEAKTLDSQKARNSEKETRYVLLPGITVLIAATAIGAYLSRPDALSVFAAFGVIVLVFRFCVGVMSRWAGETVETEDGAGAGSLLALAYPILAIFWMGSYNNPPAPWSDLMGYGLASLGYALAFAGFMVRHFRILGLHTRKATLFAAIAFFVAGTVLSNLQPLAADFRIAPDEAATQYAHPSAP